MKHSYNYSKPKFCSGCGSSIGPSLPKSTASKTRSSEYEYEDEEEYDPENSDADYVPSINKIQVEIENYSESNCFSLGSVFGQASNEPKTTRRRRASSVDDFVSSKTRRE
jgi:hypothetical protein